MSFLFRFPPIPSDDVLRRTPAGERKRFVTPQRGADRRPGRGAREFERGVFRNEQENDMNAETTDETNRVTAETEIRELVDAWRAAIVERDIDRIVSHYAPDIVAFDAIKALQFKGVDAYRKHWEACMAMCSGPMSFEVHELAVSAGDDVAFSHALNRCCGTTPDGKEDSHWMRMTAGYRRVGGKWRVVHEHFSAPFDVETLKVLDLVP